MKCDSCHEREATIVFTTVWGDEKQTRNLCPVCAKSESERQARRGNPPGQKVAPTHVPEVKKVNVVVGHLTSPEPKTAPCPGCGMTYEEFRKVGRLGCPECYTAFGVALRRLLKRIHGADAHVGRGPRPQVDAQPHAGVETLAQLRQELQRAVDEEAYERAAEIRDRIARLGGCAR